MTIAIAGVLARHGDGPDPRTFSAQLAPLGDTGQFTSSLGPVDVVSTRIGHDEREPIAIVSSRGALTIGDCRLSNRVSLAQLLGRDAGSVPNASDVQLVAASWDKWGPACFAKLEGEFAVAIFEPSTQRLILARDPLGLRPLYFAAGDGGQPSCFASQVAPLLANLVAPKLDQNFAARQLLLLSDYADDHTAFVGIHRVKPGHWAEITSAGVTQHQHWFGRASTVSYGSPEDWAEALGAEIKAATARACDSATEIVSHLSGGLDSSALTCLALAAKGDATPLKAISFSAKPTGDPMLGHDAIDGEFVQAILDHTGIGCSYVPYRQVPFLTHLETTAPGMMPPEYATSDIHQSLGSSGVDVIISGWGGDDFASFGGQGHLADLLAHGRFRAVSRYLRVDRPNASPRSHAAHLLNRGVVPLLPDRMLWFANARVRRTKLADRIQTSVVRADVADSHGLVDAARSPLRTQPSTSATQTAFLENGHLQRRIESWDADASRFGISYKYPLLDPKVIELCLAMPGEVYLRDGHSRWVFRRGLQGSVPDSVLWRKDKKDSHTQLQLAHKPSTSELVTHAQAVLDSGVDLAGCLDRDKLKRKLDAFSPAMADKATEVEQRADTIALSQMVRLAQFAQHNGAS